MITVCKMAEFHFCTDQLKWKCCTYWHVMPSMTGSMMEKSPIPFHACVAPNLESV